MTTRRSGFTVIEVLLATAVFAILVFVIASLRGNVSTLSNLVTQKLQSRQDIDRVMDQIVTEIRSAAPSSQGAYPVVAASTSSLTFYSDVDSDGLFERVRYYLATSSAPTSTLMRGVTKPAGSPLTYATSTETASVLISSLLASSTSPVFQYYGAGFTGSQAALPATSTAANAVRAVRVTFYVDVRPREAPKPAFVSQLVTIRNLRDE